jgi:hypothetical protein
MMKNLNRWGWLLFVLLFVTACKDDEIVPENQCDWDYLLQDHQGIADNIKISTAYWVFSSGGQHSAEANHYLTLAHGNPDYISDVEQTDMGWILDIEWYLLDYANHKVRDDIDAQLAYLTTQVEGKLDSVKMFYVADEPYLPGKEITREMLEFAINKVNEYFPGIPTYITFARDYFVTTPNEEPGTQPGSKRGIPQNVDYISFDWYSDDSDGDSRKNVEEQVKPTLEIMNSMAPGKPVLLVVEAFDRMLDDTRLPEAVFRYWDLACSNPSVAGLDHFLWMNDPNFHGLTSLPITREVVKALSTEVRRKIGMPPANDHIPVYEYVDAHQENKNRFEYKYDAWFWRGWTKTCYLPKKVAFYLAPAGKENTQDLYLCYVDKTKEVKRGYPFYDHRLSTDKNCGGEQLARGSKLLGGIFTSQVEGTVPLYEFVSNDKGEDHAYSTDPNGFDDVKGYSVANNGEPIGFVYPAGE